MSKILTIVQARVASERFPEKVLKPILGRPLLMRQIERIQNSRLYGQLVVATSFEPEDQPIVEMCEANGVNCFRGDPLDVLDRYYQTAAYYRPDHILRLTADCPLIDPQLIDYVIEYHLKNKNDFSSGASIQSFPLGLDVEVCRFETLEDAWKNARDPVQREHVMPYMYQNPRKFKLGFLARNQSLAHHRWTVDFVEDYQLVVAVYEALYKDNPRFTTADILNFLDQNPEVLKINSHYIDFSVSKINDILKDIQELVSIEWIDYPDIAPE